MNSNFFEPRNAILGTVFQASYKVWKSYKYTLRLLKPLCLQFNAEAINRWLYLELVPCDVSEEESETSIPELLDNIFPHSFHS